MTDPTGNALLARIKDLEEGLDAAIRAANLALFVIKKQGIMPNSRKVDLRMIWQQLGKLEINDRTINNRSSARPTRYSGQYVSDVRYGKSSIGPKIYTALGLRKVVMFERIEENDLGQSTKANPCHS